jgi:hypothetical protein
MDILALDDTQLFEQCEFDRFRASGPGGQKRNRTNSAVRLRHLPTGLQAEANESRSQHENRARALQRLRLTAAVTLRAGIEPSYEPPEFVAHALTHPPGRRDPKFLPVLAALFDVLEACEWRLSEAAELLGTNSAAVTRLLVVDDRIWRAATERRQAFALPPLRHTR